MAPRSFAVFLLAAYFVATLDLASASNDMVVDPGTTITLARNNFIDANGTSLGATYGLVFDIEWPYPVNSFRVQVRVKGAWGQIVQTFNVQPSDSFQFPFPFIKAGPVEIRIVNRDSVSFFFNSATFVFIGTPTPTPTRLPSRTPSRTRTASRTRPTSTRTPTPSSTRPTPSRASPTRTRTPTRTPRRYVKWFPATPGSNPLTSAYTLNKPIGKIQLVGVNSADTPVAVQSMLVWYPQFWNPISNPKGSGKATIYNVTTLYSDFIRGGPPTWHISTDLTWYSNRGVFGSGVRDPATGKPKYLRVAVVFQDNSSPSAPALVQSLDSNTSAAKSSAAVSVATIGIIVAVLGTFLIIGVAFVVYRKMHIARVRDTHVSRLAVPQSVSSGSGPVGLTTERDPTPVSFVAW
eukprot:CAMPEP_0184340072 /NCGR_PEP_ID=MMETSP1089-20130417/8725_1 /TAXON_ID=38269 ORGANISM="Gloeochaete wittrockiana, Strain SAG46.84" /NCGR_SAMPLE_ID=MMETSP1089 /ASSEMBLY_ACC=CAM_ASM_000445 /LENGTH=405 /DNA_ID=CAMNT_0026667679 /DNA_START=190 /DNA_END=1404 /DNA_ORIENTATION=+